MAQKPVLRGEVGCACVAREVSVDRGGMCSWHRRCGTRRGFAVFVSVRPPFPWPGDKRGAQACFADPAAGCGFLLLLDSIFFTPLPPQWEGHWQISSCQRALSRARWGGWEARGVSCQGGPRLEGHLARDSPSRCCPRRRWGGREEERYVGGAEGRGCGFGATAVERMAASCGCCLPEILRSPLSGGLIFCTPPPQWKGFEKYLHSASNN